MNHKHILSKNMPSWYGNYGAMLNEQNAVAVFSDEPDERIRQYLDANEGLLTELDKLFNEAQDGTMKEAYLELDAGKYQVMDGDELNIIIDRTDPDDEKVVLGLENEEILLGDLNLTTLAGYVYKSMDGAGTYEDMYAGSMAAITKDLVDRGISQRGQQRVFDIFNNKVFGTKYEGDSLDEWIDGDFDGRAEACAMAIAKRPIPKSMLRGVNWGTIGLDILLLAIPFAGPMISAGIKTGTASVRGAKLTAKLMAKTKKIKDAAKVIGKTKAVQKMIAAGKVFQKITPGITKAWKALSTAARLRYTKLIMPVGKKMTWLVKAGKGTKEINVVVKAYKTNKAGKQIVVLSRLDKAGKAVPGAISPLLSNFMPLAGKAGGPTMKTATKLAVGAGLVGAISKGETGNLDGSPTVDPAVAGEGAAGMDPMFNVWNPAELMGYYDQSKADPAKAMAQYKNLAAGELATALHDAMDGWTDNSDELAIALMVLSMDKQTAIAVKTEYETMYAGTKFYADVIANELESDMEQIVGNYWAALTGDGPHVANVNKYLGYAGGGTKVEPKPAAEAEA